MSAPDLGLSLPLQGVQLIEASAGTGKTFTVATLYARLVLEAGLPVSRLLAVTFTEAATRELRARLRARLVLAQHLLEGDAREHALAEDSSDDGEVALSKSLLRAALAREGAPLLRRRLRLAVEQMDLAPIHTIHAFCQRALSEHALLAGQPLAPRELLPNEAGLRREVATAFWRRHSRAAGSAAALARVWKSPQKLAENLVELMAPDALAPEPPEEQGAAALAALRSARNALANAFREHGEEAETRLLAAWNAGALHKGSFRSLDMIEAVFGALRRWADDPLPRDPAHDKLGNFATTVLVARTNKKHSTPTSELFEAIEAWSAARSAHERALDGRALALVHEARAFAIERIARLKRERGLLGFDDLIREVDEALAHPDTGPAFAQALQRQYAVALVDEFQDTDPRQWRIFHRLFAHSSPDDDGRHRALVLIGDPKQAIYRFRGGDVATYLAAKAEAPAPAPLRVNFRSRPRVLAGVQALFELREPDAFASEEFGFIAVAPAAGNRDEDFCVDGAPGPGLQVQPLAASSGQIDEDRVQATAHCVAAIHALLQAGQQGRAFMQPEKGPGPRAVRPGDIGVLVPTNADAGRIQRALSEAGIPSVAAGRCSIYHTDEARDACWLLEALAAPADDGRLRALLASPLFGLDAAALAALDTDLATHRGYQDELQRWLQRARRHGPLAALAEICAREAPRLLALPDGERRLSNYLQLAEELQAADLGALGVPGLLAELERRIADADDRNDAELLRLESDSARVRIMTMHVSKGLTLDFVFLPYAATCGASSHRSVPPMARVRDGLARISVLYPEKGGVEARAQERDEAAEDLRVLYVALTRARLMTWVAWGACKDAHGTALAWLLHRSLGDEIGGLGKLEADALPARLQELKARAPAAIAVLDARPAPAPDSLPRLPFVDASALPAARVARRAIDRDWWVYSFSQLAREDSGALEGGGADDETEPVATERSRFSGTRFGNALHQALEHVDFAAWRDWRDLLPPPGQFEPLQRALSDHGYASEADQQEGLPLLSTLVRETLNAPLPEGTRLAQLATAARSQEMEFHMALSPLSVARLLELLHAHGLLRERRNFGARQRLEGLLTGKIDLVYEADGRYYVLDYKSNQLPDYGAETLARAVREGEYDLQYVLYTLALHRWLRFRLGAAYRIDAHLGGVRYLFCRGLDRHDPSAPGVHALRLPSELVLALDALFAAERAA